MALNGFTAVATRRALCGVGLAIALLAPAAAYAVPLCVNPAKFGAVANDGLDDRAAFQQAIDFAKKQRQDICIGAGNWHFSKPTEAGANGIASLKIYDVQNALQIYGVGPATRLHMLGSGRRGDWRLIEVGRGSKQVILRDLHLDGALRTDTEEQTHLLQVTGPVRQIRVQRVQFNLPRIAGLGGGDCIRLLGEAHSPVQLVQLLQVTGLHCDRSFIALQRGLEGVLINGARSILVGDQAVDSEPTGGLGMRDIRIKNSQFARGPDAQGGYTVALGGGGENFSSGIQLVNSVVLDGGIHVIDAAGVLIQDVSVTGAVASPAAGAASPVLHIRKRAIGVLVSRTTLTRPAGAGVGEVVSIHAQSGQAPHDVTIERSRLVQNTAAMALRAEALEALSMRSNTFEMASTAPGASAFAAVSVRGLEAAALRSVRLDLNKVSGSGRSLLRAGQLAGAGDPQITVTRNVAPTVLACGVEFNGPPPTQPAPVISGNQFGGRPLICQ